MKLKDGNKLLRPTRGAAEITKNLSNTAIGFNKGAISTAANSLTKQLRRTPR
jgi:hypothetical protein